jgi:hypothetical protein
LKVVRDFEAFTAVIAGHDPEKIVALERGPVSLYWDVAQGYARRLVAEQERVKKAARRHGR